MAIERPNTIRPGVFGTAVAADSRRYPFDAHNESLLALGRSIGVVFIGDSITDWWPVDAFFTSPAGLIVNRGIGGDRTPFLRLRYAADALQLGPRLIVLKIGVNNAWDLDIWIDASLRRTPEAIEEEIVADVAAIAADTRAAGIPLALCSILPTDVPFNGNTAERNALIARANARLQVLAKEQGAVWVDYHRHLVGDDGLTLRAGLADDGLHPHVVGYGIMADVLLEALDDAGISALARRTD